MARTKDATASELVREARAAAHLIAEIGNVDPALSQDMIEGETRLLEVIDVALSEIDECEIMEAGCKAKVDEITGRMRRLKARREMLRGLIEQSLLMAEQATLKTDTATITVRKVNPKPLITDEALIPSKYWRQPDPVLDRKAINESDEQIPGVTLDNGGTSLTIRRT